MLTHQVNWFKVYQDRNAVWTHDGNPKRPHLLFTDGLHAKSYVQGKIITRDFKLCDGAAYELLKLLQSHKTDVDTIRYVVGPDGSLAERIAFNLGTERRHPCDWATPKKEGDGKNKKFIFPNPDIFVGETVLLCDDTWTSGSSLKLIRKVLQDAGAKVLTIEAVIWNRSGLQKTDGRTIISLINVPLQAWTAEECKEKYLCSVGSEAIRPKTEADWARLTAIY